jgi:hypothetical protein
MKNLLLANESHKGKKQENFGNFTKNTQFFFRVCKFCQLHPISITIVCDGYIFFEAQKPPLITSNCVLLPLHKSSFANYLFIYCFGSQNIILVKHLMLPTFF